MVELQKVNPVTQATKDEFTRISTDKTNIAVNIVNQKSVSPILRTPTSTNLL